MTNLEVLSANLTTSLKNFFIKNRIKCTIYQGKLLFIDWNVTTTITITDIDDNGSNNMITENYIISSPEWDRDFIETSCSFGRDNNELIENATKNVAYGILTPVFMYYHNDYTSLEETHFVNKIHKWNVYAGAAMQSGNLAPMDDANIYWDAIKESVLQHVGNQKTCFVKLFLSNSGNGNIICECLLNDEVIDGPTYILNEFASRWNVANVYTWFKQYIIISQDKKTYTPYPYTKPQIMEYVQKSMVCLEKSNYQMNDNFYSMQRKLIPDKSLIWELNTFIPEICASLEYADMIRQNSMIFGYKNETFNVNPSQIASYYMIQDGIIRALNSKLLQDANRIYSYLVGYSSIAKAVYQASNEGSPTVASCTMFNPPDDYIFR